MTPEDRAKRLSAVLVDELGIPDWQREMVGLWVQGELSAAAAAERERCAKVAADAAEHHRDHCPAGCRCADGWHIAARIREGGAA